MHFVCKAVVCYKQERFDLGHDHLSKHGYVRGETLLFYLLLFVLYMRNVADQQAKLGLLRLLLGLRQLGHCDSHRRLLHLQLMLHLFVQLLFGLRRTLAIVGCRLCHNVFWLCSGTLCNVGCLSRGCILCRLMILFLDDAQRQLGFRLHFLLSTGGNGLNLSSCVGIACDFQLLWRTHCEFT